MTQPQSIIVHRQYVTTDDAPAIQAAINYVATTGGIVQLQAGTYNISQPLILPRTGPLPTTAVQIIGAGQYATNLHGLPGFPANRGLIEWAPGAGDLFATFGQKISNLTFWLPNGVPGVKAIWHQVAADALASSANVQREWMQLDLENVRIECNNTDHEVLIDLGIGCRFSRWANVVADPWTGPAPKFDTLLVRTPTTYTGFNPQVPIDDAVGFSYCHLSNLYPMLVRGGACRTIEARAVNTTLEHCVDNGGRMGTGAIAFHFTNSAQLILRQIGCECNGSAFIRLDNCINAQIENVSAGTPPHGATPAQDSITLHGCRNVKIRGRVALLGGQQFSGFGVHSLLMDAACVDCRATDYDVAVTAGGTSEQLAAAEISIDPAAAGCGASGTALQAWQNYQQAYSIGN